MIQAIIARMTKVDNSISSCTRGREAMKALYALQGSVTGLVYVGGTMDFHRRLRNHQSALSEPFRVICLHQCQNPLEGERLFHDRLGAYVSHGSWYRPNPELLTVLADLSGH